MIKQRLINCDFLNFGGFLDSISNKAKLLYFLYIVNADDMGFVGNGVKLAKGLDECEQNFDNTLFAYKYVDSISELITKGFVYVFSDKHNNQTFLIRHWFKHNKYVGPRATNFISYLSKVDIVNGEYELKTNQEKKPLKEKEMKGNENKTKNHNTIEKDFIDSSVAIVEKELTQEKENKDWEKEWDETLKALSDIPND